MDRLNVVMNIDHIGYAVKNMENAKSQFKILGFVFGDEKVDGIRDVKVSVGENNGIKVELIAPIDGKKSPIDGYLSKVGNTPYHICYKVDNIEIAIETLKTNGYILLGTVAPSAPLGGNVCFLYSPEIGIVELICYEE